MLKRAFNSQNLELWNDYKRHTSVYLAITKAIGQALNLDIHVPKVFEYYTRDSQKWLDKNPEIWPSAALRVPTDLLETELILSLPEIIRESLISHYCAPYRHVVALNDPRNRDYLISVCLGVRRENRNFQPGFSLRNFETDFNTLDELQSKEHIMRRRWPYVLLRCNGK